MEVLKGTAKSSKTDHTLLDAEWAKLILEARSMGMTIEDIRLSLAMLQTTELVKWQTAAGSAVG
ncbi:anti-repressor SinI family protein [Cohnella soli]|uniref:Anti-repressor SinI family protein n=1 Tax=Cohnella soli TaxID=425005 RepID=A0ABW0I1R7_9BACL